MKKITDLINDVMSTIEIHRGDNVSPGDIVVELRGVLRPSGRSPEEFLEILHNRFKKNPRIFLNSILKLLRYKKEGKKVLLTTRPIWYSAVVRVFYRALAECLVEKVIEEYQSADVEPLGRRSAGVDKNRRWLWK